MENDARFQLEDFGDILWAEDEDGEIYCADERMADHCCPDCERPNQFGELCDSCRREQESVRIYADAEWQGRE